MLQIIPGFNYLLLVEPLELFFPFEINKDISCPLYLTNQTNCYIAFNIHPASQLQYCIKPNLGIVPPLCSCRVNITLQAQDKAPPKDMLHDEFIVMCTQVKEGLTSEDITDDIFSKERGNLVEEVNLDAIFNVQVKTACIFQQRNQDLPAGAIGVLGIGNKNELEASGGPQSSTNTSSVRTDLQVSTCLSNIYYAFLWNNDMIRTLKEHLTIHFTNSCGDYEEHAVFFFYKNNTIFIFFPIG